MHPYELHKENVFVSEQTATCVIYSGQLFIISALVTFYLGHYYLCFASICLYFSTMLFWSNVHSSNLNEIKLLDMTIALTTILLVLFYYTPKYIKPQYKYIVYAVFTTSLLVYVINELMYHYTVKTHPDYSKIANGRRHEFINEITIYSHILFLHILPVVSYSCCALLSM
jgi:hypothetical protein